MKEERSGTCRYCSFCYGYDLIHFYRHHQPVFFGAAQRRTGGKSAVTPHGNFVPRLYSVGTVLYATSVDKYLLL